MGRTTRNSGSSSGGTSNGTIVTLPFSDGLHPIDAEILFHDIPLRILASPLFDGSHHAHARVTPDDTLTLYLSPGRGLSGLCHTVRQVTHVHDVLDEIGKLQEKLGQGHSLIGVTHRLVGIAELAVAIRAMAPCLGGVARLFCERMLRARRVLARDGRGRRSGMRNGVGRGVARTRHGDYELMVEIDGSASGPLDDGFVRTMVQLLHVETLPVLTWHELVALVDRQE